MTRKIIIILFVLVSLFGFSQSEKDNYEIYSTVIKDRLENQFEGSISKIILVNRIQNTNDGLEMLEHYAADSLEGFQVSMIQNYSSPPELTTMLIENKDLRKLLAHLKSDFEVQSKINPKFLTIENIELETISNRIFQKLIRNSNKSINKNWDKIEKKYGTRFILQVSKIKYMDKLATLFITYQCGGLCGAGRLLVLEKEHEKWNILGELVLFDM
jgi:hypothetical protein